MAQGQKAQQGQCLCRCKTVAAVGPGYVLQTEMAFGLQFEGAVRHHEGCMAAEAQGS